MSLLTSRSVQTQLELRSTPRLLLVAAPEVELSPAFAAGIGREMSLLLKVLRKRLEKLREALRQLSRFRQKMISFTRFSRPKLMSISQRRCARVRSVFRTRPPAQGVFKESAGVGDCVLDTVR